MIITNNIDDLIQALGNQAAGCRAVIVTQTAVKMNKKDVATKLRPNPNGVVYKVQTTEVELNTKYEEKVNEQRAAEDLPETFVAKERKWGKFVNDSILVKNDAFYLHTIPVAKIGSAVYQNEKGEPVDYTDLLPWIPAMNTSSRQEVDNVVKVRDYNLANVISLTVEGRLHYTKA